MTLTPWADYGLSQTRNICAVAKSFLKLCSAVLGGTAEDEVSSASQPRANEPKQSHARENQIMQLLPFAAAATNGTGRGDYNGR